MGGVFSFPPATNMLLLFLSQNRETSPSPRVKCSSASPPPSFFFLRHPAVRFFPLSQMPMFCCSSFSFRSVSSAGLFFSHLEERPFFGIVLKDFPLRPFSSFPFSVRRFLVSIFLFPSRCLFCVYGLLSFFFSLLQDIILSHREAPFFFFFSRRRLEGNGFPSPPHPFALPLIS